MDIKVILMTWSYVLIILRQLHVTMIKIYFSISQIFRVNYYRKLHLPKMMLLVATTTAKAHTRPNMQRKFRWTGVENKI